MLEVFSSFPLYSNAATALHPIDQWKKEPVAMQNRNQAKASCGLTQTCGAWKQHKVTPFLSIACVKRIDGKDRPLRKLGSLLGIPKIVFESYLNSREGISVLRFLKKAILPHDGG